MLVRKREQRYLDKQYVFLSERDKELLYREARLKRSRGIRVWLPKEMYRKVRKIEESIERLDDDPNF